MHQNSDQTSASLVAIQAATGPRPAATCRTHRAPDRSLSLAAFDPDALLTPQEVARITGLSPGYLAQCRMEAGRGPPFVRLGRVFYRVQAVRDWLRKKEVPSTDHPKT